MIDNTGDRGGETRRGGRRVGDGGVEDESEEGQDSSIVATAARGKGRTLCGGGCEV